MMDIFQETFPQLFIKFWEHLYLACFSTLAAILFGMPLGIMAAKFPKVRPYILSSANILQTVPSLALLAFLIPFIGIGTKPALVTLAVYAVLPIIRNTQTGIESISQDILQAAEGIGFKPHQTLFYIELPLAIPFIIAGMRTAAVMGVGIATIAAFIGAGGLGDFIYRGISSNNPGLILLGAVPAALLALLMDNIFGRIETHFAPTSHKTFTSKARVAVVLAISILLIALGPWIVNKYRYGNVKTVVVASKNFTEQLILGELISELLENRTSFKVIKKLNLGSTEICQEALLRGDIDIYPEYSGTAYLVVLKKSIDDIDNDNLFEFVKKEYIDKFNITWLSPLGFSNSEALAVHSDFAEQHSIQTISDLKPHAKKMCMAAPDEFMQRPDGYETIAKGYNLHFKQIKQMESGLMYPAINTREADVITAFRTDGRLHSGKLKLLKDDKKRFPEYDASILVRNALLQDHPELKNALHILSGIIDEQTIKRLNYQVDVEGKSPKKVARKYLLEMKLLL